MTTLCVYCASSDSIPARYVEAAHVLGNEIVRRGWGLVYGGGSIGLMGQVAHVVRDAGGHVIGVIPQALYDREIAFVGASELIVTQTMRQRKQIMEDRADAFLTLAGGFGTLEELLEIMTLRLLGYHDKPIVIINTDGYYDALIAQFERIFAEQFAPERYRRIYQVVADPLAGCALLAAIFATPR